jgi:hypothetical protein
MSFVPLAVAAIVFIALVECGLRLYHRHFSREYFAPPNRRTILSIHPEVSPALSKEALFRTNAWGERGDDPPRARRLYRGLVVGGSASECSLLDQDQTWPMQIQHNLRKAIRDGQLRADAAHVGNMSRSGMTTEGIFVALSRILPSFPRLDFICIHTSASDFLHWLDFEAPAIPTFKPERAVDVLGVCRARVFGWKPKSLAMTYYLRAFAESELLGRSLRMPIGRRIVATRKLRAQSHPHSPLQTGPTLIFEKVRSDLADLIRLCRQHVRHVIVVPQLWLEPAPGTESIFWFGQIGRRSSGAGEKPKFILHSDVERLYAIAYDVVLETAAAAGAHSVPLRGILAQEVRNLYDDAHYSALGSALLGKILADKILEIEASSQQ